MSGAAMYELVRGRARCYLNCQYYICYKEVYISLTLTAVCLEQRASSELSHCYLKVYLFLISAHFSLHLNTFNYGYVILCKKPWSRDLCRCFNFSRTKLTKKFVSSHFLFASLCSLVNECNCCHCYYWWSSRAVKCWFWFFDTNHFLYLSQNFSEIHPPPFSIFQNALRSSVTHNMYYQRGRRCASLPLHQPDSSWPCSLFATPTGI